MHLPLLRHIKRAFGVSASVPPHDPMQASLRAAALHLPPLCPPKPCDTFVHAACKTAPQTLYVPDTQQTFHLCKNGLGSVDSSQGPVGRVKIGYDVATGEAVAIKKLRRIPAAQRGIAHLYVEAASARAAHSDLCPQALLTTDARMYMVMPLMAGDMETLADAAGAGKSTAMLQGMHAVLTDLQRSHQLGVAHRDIKPANIMHRGSPDSVRLGDYGAACSTSPQSTGAGTPYHMSPEQHLARIHALASYDPVRADIWGVGATFLDLWCGNPFRANTAERRMMHDDYARWYKRTSSAWRWRVGSRATWRFARAFGRLPRRARPLMLGLLHPDPLARPTVAQALTQVEHLLARANDTAAATEHYRNAAQHMCQGWGPLR